MLIVVISMMCFSSTVFAEKDLSDITFTGEPSTVFDSLRIDGYQINDCTTEMKGKGWSVKNDTIYLNEYDSSGITIRAFDNVSAVQIVVTTNSEITDGLYGINCNVGLRLQGSGSSSVSTLDINAGSCGINCTGLLGFYNGRFNISCIDNGKTYAGINQSHYMTEHCTIAKNATVVVDWKATSWDDFYGIKGVSIISGSDDGIGKLSVATENKGKGNAYATDMSDSVIKTIKSSATVYPSDEQHFFVNMVGIDRLDLTVVEPEIGKTPSKVVSVEQSGVGVEIAGWMEKGKGTYLKDNETYKASTEYIPQFLVKLSDFCEYYPDVEVTVNGKTATFNIMQANNNKVISDISFKTGNNVTFDLNGGTWTDAGTNPQVVNDGETAIRPTDPTKSGHVFAGWYADSACTTPFSFLTAITSNKTIYAKWNIITNSVNAILSPTPSLGLTIGDLVLTSGDSSKYSVSAGYWKLNDSGSALDKSSTQFEAGQTYTLYLTYYPENGYTIPDDATYTVNGIPTEWSGFEAESNRKISFTIPAVTTHNVTFDLNGGTWTDAGTNPQVVNDGETAIRPTNPTKDGFEFAGWYVDAGFITLFDFDGITISENKTLYAKWNEIINSVSATITLPTANANPVFTGTAGDSTYRVNQLNISFRDLSTNTELTAGDTFEAGKTYRIIVWFTPNLGYYIPTTATATINEQIASFWTSLADGYGSKGYYIDYTIPTAQPTEYNVTVTGGTASVGAGAPITKATMGTTVTLTAGAAPTGQMFDKWVVNGVVVDDANSATTTFVMPAGEVTATATYKDIPVVTYTVTFDSAGGSAVTAQTIEAGQKATKPADPTKAGYDFKGWTLNGSAYDFNSAVNGDITLVATWEQQQVVPTVYTVTFDSNGGSAVTAQTIEEGQKATKPADPTKAGYDFKGWTLNGSAYDFNTVVNGDITLVATWETIPAGHTCDIKPVAKVEPSCTEGGKEAYYKCEGCGKFYEDALGVKEITDLAAWGNIAKNGHTESDWKSDKDNHWKECTVAACGVIIENSRAAHADANNDGKCDTCEYTVGTTTTNPDNKPSDDVQSPQTGDNSMMWLWVALLFVSGFGVVATTVIGKKKSSAK